MTDTVSYRRHEVNNEKTHHTTLAVQVGVHLLLESGLIHVTGANGDTNSDGLLLSLASNVLPNSNGRVDTAAFLEESTDSAAGTLRGNEDDVDVFRRNDVGVVLVDDRETVGEVEGLALGDEGRDLGPCLRLGGVGEQVHDDGSTLDGLLNGEESLTGDLCGAFVSASCPWQR